SLATSSCPSAAASSGPAGNPDKAATRASTRPSRTGSAVLLPRVTPTTLATASDKSSNPNGVLDEKPSSKLKQLLSRHSYHRSADRPIPVAPHGTAELGCGNAEADVAELARGAVLADAAAHA